MFYWVLVPPLHGVTACFTMTRKNSCLWNAACQSSLVLPGMLFLPNASFALQGKDRLARKWRECRRLNRLQENRGGWCALVIFAALQKNAFFFDNVFTMISSEFRPSVFHPYYFIRKGLLQKIYEHGSVLHGKLLDFGCGSKPYKSLVKVEQYTGVDYVNEGHPHDNEQIDIFYDGKTIPVENDSFDSVLSSEVFEHVFNLEEVLGELHRVLKKGGVILITCPFVWKEHEVPNDFARYTHFALKHLFEKNGFKVRTMDKSGNFIEVLFQLRVLYFYDNWWPKCKKIPLVNLLFKCLFIALPNAWGALLSKWLPSNKQLYFNNIVVAEKM